LTIRKRNFSRQVTIIKTHPRVILPIDQFEARQSYFQFLAKKPGILEFITINLIQKLLAWLDITAKKETKAYATLMGYHLSHRR
jgi:hypothetical protein